MLPKPNSIMAAPKACMPPPPRLAARVNTTPSQVTTAIAQPAARICRARVVSLFILFGS
jgi:hypothetical protein